MTFERCKPSMSRQKAVLNNHRLLFDIELLKRVSIKKIIAVSRRAVASSEFCPHQIDTALGLPHMNQLMNQHRLNLDRGC